MGEYGSRDAALALRILEEQCEYLKLVVLLGVCAGIPCPPAPSSPIYLGDVILATAVLAHAKGARDEPGRLSLRENSPHAAPHKIRHFLNVLGTEYESEELTRLSQEEVRGLQSRFPTYRHPGADVLFDGAYHHVHRPTCPQKQCLLDGTEFCKQVRKTPCEDAGCEVARATRVKSLGQANQNNNHPFSLHSGVYASADIVTRNPSRRDLLAAEHGILAFEMEAAGIWDLSPYVMVIKGVSDYGDTHKNHQWQNRAALHAACITKMIVRRFFSGGI